MPAPPPPGSGKGCVVKVREPADVKAEIAAADAFHAHLDKCSHCENHPFALCETGARLLAEFAKCTRDGVAER